MFDRQRHAQGVVVDERKKIRVSTGRYARDVYVARSLTTD